MDEEMEIFKEVKKEKKKKKEEAEEKKEVEIRYKFDLSLTQKDLNIIIKSFNHRKAISPKPDKNIYLKDKDYNNKLILKHLSNKKNELLNELSKINEQNDYIQESSINSLQIPNFINKKSQIKLVKNLKESKENLIDKVFSINQQINQIKENQKNNFSSNENSKEEYSENIRQQYINSSINRIINNNINLKMKKIDEDLNKDQINKLKKNNFTSVNKSIKNLNNKSANITLSKEKHKSFVNNIITPKRKSGYLYQKMTSSFDEKEQNYIKERLKNKNFDIQKCSKLEIKYNSLKKKIDNLENLNKLQKIWKERSELLPKYVSPFYKQIISDYVNEKNEEKNKIEQKKLLYELKQNYGKEKINLPEISLLLKKDWDKRKLKFNLNKSKRSNNIINNNLNSKLIRLRKNRDNEIHKEIKSSNNIFENEESSKNNNIILF